MNKIYVSPRVVQIYLDTDEMMVNDVSTNLEDTEFGGNSDGHEGLEGDTKGQGIWQWNNSDE